MMLTMIMAIILALHIGFLEVAWVDLADMFLVGVLFYQVYKLMRGTVGIRVLVAFLLLYLAFLVFRAAKMDLLSSVFGQITGVGAIAVIILFQQEIRRFILLLGRTTTSGRWSIAGYVAQIFSKTPSGAGTLDVSELMRALKELSRTHTGALIVLSRESGLETYTQQGDTIDARVTARLLEAIFQKNGPMHDGAVIIYEGRIVAARCILPINEHADISPQFGTRHRAAIGLSEQTETFILVVSEERGHVSTARRGTIRAGLPLEQVREQVEQYFKEEVQAPVSPNPSLARP